jgi:ribonuclease D
VIFIGKESDCEILRSLTGKDMVGMDSEWRPQMTKFDVMRPALLQLSDESNAFLIDLIALANSQVLDQILTELFTHEKTIYIGFSFKSDMDVFAKHLPKMNFYKYMRNFIDAQTYYSKVYVAGQQTGLAKVAKEVLSYEICKGEQMSNWELRPMRLSQQHYAALDAYCLIPIMRELTKRAQASMQPALLLENNVHSLRWTGGEKNSVQNEKPSHNNGGGDRSTKEALDRNKRTRKRAEQRKNNKYNNRRNDRNDDNSTNYSGGNSGTYSGGYSGGGGYAGTSAGSTYQPTYQPQYQPSQPYYPP